MELITIDELALKIRKSPQTIYNDLKRNPKSLPPRVNLPNTRRVLFTGVDEWIKSYLTQYSEKPLKARRGRPTKAQQLTRQPRVEHASATRRARVSHASITIKNPTAARLAGLLYYI